MSRLGGRGAPAAASAPVADPNDDPFADAAPTRDGRLNATANATSNDGANKPQRRRRGQAKPPLESPWWALFLERLDWGLVLPFFACAGLLGAYILNHVEPYQRTVSLADRTIAMPVVAKQQQMPGYVAPFVPAMVLLGCAIAAEFVPLLPSLKGQMRARASFAGGKSEMRPARPALAFAALIRAMGGMLCALTATACMTEFLKIYCGRPRPDFLSRCVPRVPVTTSENAGLLLDDLVLSSGKGPVLPVDCTGTDRAAIVESRKSFPSGHSSSASSVGLWGALYCLYSLRRLGGRGGGTVPSSWSSASSSFLPRLLRELAGSAALLMMLFFLAWPWGVGATRFVDNRHHPSDIIGGILLGAFMTLPFFARFAAVSDAWDERDARELGEAEAPGAAVEGVVGGGNGSSIGGAAAVAPALATQV